MAERPRLSGDLDALLLVAGIWFLGQYIRYVLPPLFETFRGLYGVSNTTLGLLFTAMMLAYGVMQFPSGVVADRVGPVRVIAGGALGVAVGAGIVVVAPSFAVLVLAVVVLGVAMGAHKTVTITLLARLYPEHTGRAIGVLDTLGQFGGVVGPAAVVAVLAAALAWQSLFVAAAVAGALFALAVGWRLRGRLPPRRTSADGGGAAGDGGPADDRSGDADPLATARAYLAPFSDLSLVLAVGVSVAFTVAWNGFSAFLPLYLTATKGVPAAEAGLLFSLLFVAGLVQPVTGALADRVGPVHVMTGTLALAGVGLVALVGLAGTWTLAALVVAIGVGLHGFRAPRDAYLVAVIPDDVAGGTLGITRTAMMLLGSAAPAVVGYLSDVASFDVAFGAIAAVVAAGVAGGLWLGARTSRGTWSGPA